MWTDLKINTNDDDIYSIFCSSFSLSFSLTIFVRTNNRNVGDIYKKERKREGERKEKREIRSFCLFWKERRINGQSSIAFFPSISYFENKSMKCSAVQYERKEKNIRNFSSLSLSLNFNQSNRRHIDNLKANTRIDFLTVFDKFRVSIQCILSSFH